MTEQTIWVRFLGDHRAGEARPTLWRMNGGDATEMELKPRARMLVAALAVPRGLAERDGSGEFELPVLSSQELSDRTHSQRSTTARALADLERVFETHGLDLSQFALIDRTASQYGFKQVSVDVVELLHARGAPEAVDGLLGETVGDLHALGIAAANSQLFSAATLRDVAEVLGAARARREAAGRVNETRLRPPSAAHALPAGDLDDRSPPDSGAPASPSGLDSGEQRSRHRATARWWVLIVAALLGAGVLAVVLAISAREDRDARSHTPQLEKAHVEVAGGLARTWSDYTTAGGRVGKTLTAGQRVQVACRVRGFEVSDGNQWWYRLAGPPWRGRFYATADAFYNNAKTTGSLVNTPMVDRAVPACPA